MRDHPRQALTVPVLVALLFLWTSGAAGDSFPAPSEARVRALFVLNLSRFVEWPEAVIGPAGEIRLCTVGDASLTGALESASFGRKLNGLPVGVVRSAPDANWSGCHVLYVSHWSAKEVPRILSAVRGSAVLTVSDVPGFVEKGGVVGVSIDGKQVRFSVNREQARRAGLKFSSQLLRLADSRN